MADPRAALVRNEQAKLTATYLNGVAVALAALGGIAPWVATAQTTTFGSVPVALTLGCFAASAGLHLAARQVLRTLVT